MMFSGRSCNYTKLRTNLRLAINRLKLLEKKKTELALKARKEIADYISNGKDDRARIRVEHIVREDYMVEAMEIIEMFCDLLLARFGLIEKMKEMDPGLEEAIATILWASPHLVADIQEMREIQKQLTNKYSKEYVDMCLRNGFENVNEQVMHKMSIAAPPKVLIENYMVEIAKTYKVPFEPDMSVMMEEPAEVTDLINLESGGASSNIGFESYDNEINEKKKPPTPPGGGGGGGGMPVMRPTAPLSPHLPPGEAVFPPPGGVQVMPPEPPNPQDHGPIPPYQPPPGNQFVPSTRMPPPLPSVPPNLHHPQQPDPRWPSDQPLPSYNDLVSPSAGLPPSRSPRAQSPSGAEGEDANTEESLMNLPDIPGFPSVPHKPPGEDSAKSEDIDFDDLARRFQDLKKRK